MLEVGGVKDFLTLSKSSSDFIHTLNLKKTFSVQS